MSGKVTKNEKVSFAEKHPKLNFIFSLFFVGCVAFCLGLFIYFIGLGIKKFIVWLSEITTNLDAVVIVALITGTVSIVGVILSSIVAKRIEYKKSRQEYLAQKREEAYGQFVDMVYKVQENSQTPENYTQKDMIDDISKFSKEITLWGSSKVVKKWVEFREISMNPNDSLDNLFIMEEIMNEMRRDLGLKKVKKGNLLAFFINDIKEFVNK